MEGRVVLARGWGEGPLDGVGEGVGGDFLLPFFLLFVRGCGREGGAGRWIWERWGLRLNGDDAFIDGMSNAVFGDE